MRGDGSHKELNADNFDAEVVADPRVWMIKFFSGMCGSCADFQPTWDAITVEASGIVMYVSPAILLAGFPAIGTQHHHGSRAPALTGLER